MARIFIDGFNSGDGLAWDFVTGISFTANRPGFGAYCANKPYGSMGIKKLFAAKSEFYGKFRLEIQNSYSANPFNPIFSFLSGANTVAFIGWISDTIIKFYTGDDSARTLRATASSAAYPYRVWLVEFYYKPMTDGTGRFILKLDGATVIDWTGISAASGSTCDGVQIGGTGSGINCGALYFSDFILDDAAWVGPSRVGYRVPNGVGNYGQFTPIGLSTNFQNVDDIPFSAVDFNYTNTNNNIDTFQLGTLQVGTGAYTAASIKAITAYARVRKTGSPTPTHMGTVVRIGGTDSVKESFLAADTGMGVQGIWETRPDNSQAWGLSDNPEIGYKALA